MRDKKITEFDEESASELLDKGRQIAGETLDTAEALYGDAVKKATKLVRKHPLEAMAVTFGLGCLVGLIITRR